jgi:uncharacterized membrane-anchored protein YhcB (DUF1043 family)
MNKLVYVGIFVAGAAVGFLVARQLLDKKYAALAQEEIDSVKARFHRNTLQQDSMNRFGKKMDKIINSINDENSIRNNTSTFVRSSLENNKYEKAKTKYNLTKSIEQESDDELSPEEYILS